MKKKQEPIRNEYKTSFIERLKADWHNLFYPHARRKRDTMWQCSHCERLYNTEDWLKLAKKVDKDQKDHICKCGKAAFNDRWAYIDWIEMPVKGLTIRLSTVHVLLNHFGCYYETMLFTDNKNYDVDYSRRHKTREEAIAYHNHILDKLKNGQIMIKNQMK